MSGAPAITNALYREVRDMAPAIDPAQLERDACEAVEILLLECEPFLHIARGERRETFRAAWRRAAAMNIQRRFSAAATPIPVSRRGVLIALHRAVIELCQARGVAGVDLTEAYNGLVDNPSQKTDFTDERARVRALFAMIIAEMI